MWAIQLQPTSSADVLLDSALSLETAFKWICTALIQRADSVVESDFIIYNEIVMIIKDFDFSKRVLLLKNVMSLGWVVSRGSFFVSIYWLCPRYDYVLTHSQFMTQTDWLDCLLKVQQIGLKGFNNMWYLPASKIFAPWWLNIAAVMMR